MKLLGTTEKVVDKDKNGENVPKWETIEVVLVHCNLVKSDIIYNNKYFATFFNNDEYS